MAMTTTWALKTREHGLYLTDRGSLGNMLLLARRFRTVVGAAEFRARMGEVAHYYAVVKLTKRSGLELAIYRVARWIQVRELVREEVAQ